jgi:uncharacterized membrane protein
MAMAPIAPQIAAQFGRASPHLPDWSLWAGQKPQVLIHVGAALTALAIGIVLMLLPKGVGPHKLLGWTWVIAMATTAVSSLFIFGLNGDFFSIIHLLSGWTIIALPMAVFAIRRRNVMMHRRMMMGLFVGGLLIAGALAFIPGRLMFETFF